IGLNRWRTDAPVFGGVVMYRPPTVRERPSCPQVAQSGGATLPHSGRNEPPRQWLADGRASAWVTVPSGPGRHPETRRSREVTHLVDDGCWRSKSLGTFELHSVGRSFGFGPSNRSAVG